MRVEICVGMIASGKSTYARRRADDGALVICHDDLTGMLHARYRYERGLRDLYRRMEESLAWNAAAAGKDMVIDRTHLTRESRHRWIDWASRYVSANTFDGREPPRPGLIAVAFPIEKAEVHADRRFLCDPRGRSLEEWSNVARHHAEQAAKEPLGDDEGFDEIVRMPLTRPTARGDQSRRRPGPNPEGRIR